MPLYFIVSSVLEFKYLFIRLEKPMVGISTNRRARSKLILYQDLYVEIEV